MLTYLDFEKPLAELEGKIEELRHLSDSAEIDIATEVEKLQGKLEKTLKATYASLTPWQKVQVARHPDRPRCLDYINRLIEEFVPLAGDRLFGEDAAIIGGIGRFHGRSVMVIGQERGKDTASRVKHNFGMPRPEGYRKAQRLMQLADRFNLPVLTLVDTPGAFPGIDAEARGQAEAIASSMEVCLSLRVPLIALVIGEGGSGGAIALATADSVQMMEHAVYSVISPEGCASILWGTAEQAKEAAEVMKITAQDLKKLAVIDGIVTEPLGGAHRDAAAAIDAAGMAIWDTLMPLLRLTGDDRRIRRRNKFLEMGRKIAA
jgi:acetyl-CoA carboxylase carboxyl transferase subunit alpha